MADVRSRTERYLEAFETGKLDADTCNQKVRDLKSRRAELEGERTELESRRERLSLPAMDREFLRRTLNPASGGTLPRRYAGLARKTGNAAGFDLAFAAHRPGTVALRFLPDGRM